MDYYPNVDAVCWFGEEVWPAIKQLRPTARFQIVGRYPSKPVQRLTRIAGIEVVGGVPDVRPLVARASAVVAPLRIARGLQNKVLEALAMAKAVIASPSALAALQTQSSVHLLSASSKAEWVDAVSEVLANPQRRQKLGDAGRQFVERHHDWDTCLQPLGDLVHLASTYKDLHTRPMEAVGC
jgi:glycosyltransferase involved in cell wall biosynthesis